MPFPVESIHRLIGTIPTRAFTAARSGEAPGHPFPRSLHGPLILASLIGVAADQASKAWAFASPMVLSGPREIAPGLFAAALARNDGAVANLAGGRPLTATACALIGLFLFGLAAWSFCRCIEQRRGHDGLFIGLLFAGILGNAIDRLALGYVRDFLITTLWPALIFNLADVFIVLGFLLLLVSTAMSRLGVLRAMGWRG